jgi:similar to stage IV sporulation protein
MMKIHIAGNEIDAFFLEFIWYLEYKPEKCVYTAEQAAALAMERYLNKYKNILQKGVQIIEKDVKIDINGKLCIVGGYVTLRVPVTKKVPAIIPEISMDISGEGEH